MVKFLDKEGGTHAWGKFYLPGTFWPEANWIVGGGVVEFYFWPRERVEEEDEEGEEEGEGSMDVEGACPLGERYDSWHVRFFLLGGC